MTTIDKLSPYELTVAEMYQKASFQNHYPAQQWCKEQLIRSLTVRETNTTADFPGAFQNVVNYVAAKQLTNYTPTWNKVAKKLMATDLEPQREYRLEMAGQNVLDINGGDVYLPGTLPTVPEATEYQTAKFTETGKAWSTKKSGLRFHYSWEMFLSDKWDRIGRMIDELKLLAVNKDEAEVWQLLYARGAGFNGAFFKAADNFTGNPALTLRSLEQGLQIVKSRPIPNGADNTPRVNTNTEWVLLVNQGLANTAQSILNISKVIKTDVNGDEYETTPQLAGVKEVVVAPWLPNIATDSANYVNTTGWALIPANGEGNYGTTLALAGLKGHETPELRVKKDQGQALGGGDLPTDAGSFDSDTSQFRIQHWAKGNILNPDGALWSKGTGSGNNVV